MQSTCSMTSRATTASKEPSSRPRSRQHRMSPTTSAGGTRSRVTTKFPSARSFSANQPSPVPTSSTRDRGSRYFPSKASFRLLEISLRRGCRSRTGTPAVVWPDNVPKVGRRPEGDPRNVADRGYFSWQRVASPFASGGTPPHPLLNRDLPGRDAWTRCTPCGWSSPRWPSLPAANQAGASSQERPSPAARTPSNAALESHGHRCATSRS
jgi:hypothetical protein